MILNVFEERGHMWLYHWIIYMLGGFRHFQQSNGKYFYTWNFDLQDSGYQLDSLKLISDEYVPVNNIHSFSSVSQCVGEPLLNGKYDDVDHATYVFLRNLFSKRVQKKSPLGPLLYISRRNSEVVNPANKGRKTRQILNEDELLPFLKTLGFHCIQFEDYSFEEKISIFQNARIVISPNSASLTFSLFAPESATIIEILPSIHNHDHYKNICETLGISYSRFSDVECVGEAPTLGNAWNMIVKKDPFFRRVKEILLAGN